MVRLSVGSLNAANISKNLLVIGVTATVLTVIPLNGVAMVAESSIAGCTVAKALEDVQAMAAALTPAEQRELNRLLTKIILSKSNWPATV